METCEALGWLRMVKAWVKVAGTLILFQGRAMFHLDPKERAQAQA